MLVLEATSNRQGERPGDYHWCNDGELAYSQGLDCSNPGCGCARGWAGFDSHRATTTVQVVDRPELTVHDLASALAEVSLKSPEVLFLSNVDGEPHQDPEEIRDLLLQQVCSPVLWEASMRHFLQEGFDTFYEVGPGRVLRGLMKRINRKVNCHGVME